MTVIKNGKIVVAVAVAVAVVAAAAGEGGCVVDVVAAEEEVEVAEGVWTTTITAVAEIIMAVQTVIITEAVVELVGTMTSIKAVERWKEEETDTQDTMVDMTNLEAATEAPHLLMFMEVLLAMECRQDHPHQWLLP